MREQLIFIEGAFINSKKPIEDTLYKLGKIPIPPQFIWVPYPLKNKYPNPENTAAFIKTNMMVLGSPIYRLENL